MDLLGIDTWHCSISVSLSKHTPHNDETHLRSLLILPIKRIPRYKILLEEIIKNTEPNMNPKKKTLLLPLL